MKKKASKMYVIIPDDIIIGIFLRLPTKYVFKLRCVCKYWYNLISNPDFIKLHLHHHQEHDQTNHSILVFDYTPSADYDHHTMFHSLNYYKNSIDDAAAPAKWVSISTPINWKLQNGNYVPLGSCNGLLCIFTSESFRSSGDRIRVLNPCTKQCKELPQLDHERVVPPTYIHGYCTYGFGYDRINDDYKVVKNFSQRVALNGDDYITVVNVYTLGTNSWRRIEDVLPYKLKDVGVLVGGALYWRGERLAERLNHIIVGFQLGDEVLKEIPFPPLRAQYCQHLLELNGCLSIFQRTIHDTIEVWSLMNKDKSDVWAHLFTVAEPKLLMPHLYGRWTPLGASNEDGELLMKVENRELVWYNPRDGKTRFFAQIPNCQAVVKYTESLVSLKYPRW